MSMDRINCYKCKKVMDMDELCHEYSVWGYDHLFEASERKYWYGHKMIKHQYNIIPVCDKCKQVDTAEWKKGRDERERKEKEYRKGYNKRKSNELLDGYIKTLLASEGFPRESIKQNPELIETKRLIIKTKRLLKNVNHSN